MLKTDDLVPLEKTETRRFMLSHFIVTGNRKEQKSWQSTRVAVVCGSIERAIELAKEIHPGMRVLSVAHQGTIDRVDPS